MVINFVFGAPSLYPMGGHKVVFEYANFLCGTGNKVNLIYVLNDPLKSQKKRIRSAYVRLMILKTIINIKPKWFHLDKTIHTYYFLSADDPCFPDADVTIATSIKTPYMVFNLPESKGKKVYFIQGYENWDNTDDYVNKSYSLGMKNITIANWLSSIVDKYSREKSLCIPDGIDSTVFKNKSGMQRTSHSIAFHYRKDYHKGCDIALEVIKKLYQEYPDLKVEVVTNEKKYPPFPGYCTVHQRISAKKVADINNSVEVFLCTTRVEGYGLPGLEAMACGAVLVSTSYLGVLEYAKDYDENTETGNSLLAPVDDVEQLVSNVERIFNDDHLRQKLSDRGMRTATEFTVNNSAAKFESILIDMINTDGI